MKTLNRNQMIAVGIALAFVAYLLYGGSFMEFFNPSVNQDTNMTSETPEGVEVNDLTAGTGVEAEAGDTLTVHYVGRLESGKVFDSSVDTNTPFTFTLGAGQVIRGWEEGFAGMREGGRRRITISPEYGYGAQGVGTIPPNSTLIFDVELLEVEKTDE